MSTFTDGEMRKEFEANLLGGESVQDSAAAMISVEFMFAYMLEQFAAYRAYLAEKAEEMKNQYAPYPAIHSETDSMEKGGRQVLEDFSTKYLK